MQNPSGILISALKAVPESELSLFFRTLAEEKLAQVLGATDIATLQKIQHQALYIQELHQLFLKLRETKLSS